MKPSPLAHVRDILLLPGTVLVVIPFLIYDPARHLLPDTLAIRALGGLSAAFGLALFAWSVRLFGTAGEGTLAPWDATRRLVVAGPYRHCRNPMITGVLLMLLGEALWLRSAGILAWAGVFFLINTAYFVLGEEPELERRFGADYRRYRRNVPRWIPRWRPYRPHS